MNPEKQTFFVLGLSRSGRSVAHFLLKRKANVYIYDDVISKTIEETIKALEEEGAKAIKKEDVEKMPNVCDALVLSPGIAIDHPVAVAFKRKQKAVIGETEIAVRYMRCPIIAVTGTNGKTTTVSLLAEILQKGGVQAFACGNIGAPMSNFCGVDERSVAVAEISSFQLETLNSIRPHIAVVLNVTEDHLNRHYTMENYIFLKSKLLKNCTETEYAVLNFDDETVRSFAEKTKARVLWFSLHQRVNGAYLENGDLYYKGEKIMPVNALPIAGTHNVLNALAAIVCAKLMGLSNEQICDALTLFKGVKHRIQEIATVNGVTYIDDSKGTNIDATIKAVACMKKETVLLLGGKHKGYRYHSLFNALKTSKVVHAVLYGENRYQLLDSARVCGFDNVTVCPKFALAVQIAVMVAVEGQNVLLSPASASFDEFLSYEERGDRFAEMVTKLKKEHEEHSIDVEERENNNTLDKDNGVDREKLEEGQ